MNVWGGLVLQKVNAMKISDAEKKAILDRYEGIWVATPGEYTNPACASGEIACLRPRVDYFYPTKNKNACDKFPEGQTVKVLVTQACCDGDPNPPCWLGFSNLIKDLPKKEDK